MTRLTDHFSTGPDGRARLPEAEYEQLEDVLPFTRENVRRVWRERLIAAALGVPVALVIFAIAEWSARL